MNLKRWFAWVCLALMLVAEISLFRANHAKDAALTGLREAQQENRRLTDELAELKNSNAGLQVAELSRLRKQNEILTNKLAVLNNSFVALQATTAKLTAESQQNAKQLTTARTALQLQQEHMAQLQTENQQAAAAQAQHACINNLRLVDAAKQQWALDKNRPPAAVPTAQDLLPYFQDGGFPVCPAGGNYLLNAVGEWPACSVAGHDLPQQ